MNQITIEEKTDTADEPDYAAIKVKQRGAWSSGDYALIGSTLNIVGEQLAEAANINPDERVLDVAAGNGNATLAAGRRFAKVTSTDYVETLLEKGRIRAKAEGMQIDFQQADVEALPFADDTYDVVVSTFGCMFAPNQVQTAAEMARVCRPGGRIAMANWTPDSFIGELFKVIGKHVPPPAGVQSPALWGTRARLEEIFGQAASRIEIKTQAFNFRYRNVAHWLDLFRTYYGPTHKAFAALQPDAQDQLAAEMVDLAQRHNVAGDGGMVVPSAYAEVVITKRG
ncbi:MAG: class I SAM-dependent methyltransferase [Pseudomonadota bacterium]